MGEDKNQYEQGVAMRLKVVVENRPDHSMESLASGIALMLLVAVEKEANPDVVASVEMCAPSQSCPGEGLETFLTEIAKRCEVLEKEDTSWDTVVLIGIHDVTVTHRTNPHMSMTIPLLGISVRNSEGNEWLAFTSLQEELVDGFKDSVYDTFQSVLEQISLRSTPASDENTEFAMVLATLIHTCTHQTFCRPPGATLN